MTKSKLTSLLLVITVLLFIQPLYAVYIRNEDFLDNFPPFGLTITRTISISFDKNNRIADLGDSEKIKKKDVSHKLYLRIKNSVNNDNILQSNICVYFNKPKNEKQKEMIDNVIEDLRTLYKVPIKGTGVHKMTEILIEKAV